MPMAILRKLLWGAEKMASQYTQGFTADSEANIFQGIEEALIGPEPTQVVCLAGHRGVVLGSRCVSHPCLTWLEMRRT